MTRKDTLYDSNLLNFIKKLVLWPNIWSILRIFYVHLEKMCNLLWLDGAFCICLLVHLVCSVVQILFPY